MPAAKVMFQSQNEDTQVTSLVESYAFNHCVDIDIPGGNIPLDSVQDVLEDSYFYLVRNVPLSQLISEEFIGAFVKAGSVHMISQGTSIDRHDSVALTPQGSLILTLTRNTYHLLGLQGQVAPHDRKTKLTYVVTVDLTHPHFTPGTNSYEQVRACFEKQSHLTFDLLASWDPADVAVSGSSLGAYFQRCQHTCVECRVDWAEEHRSWHTTPVIQHDTPGGSDAACSSTDLHEWLGGSACGIQTVAGGSEQAFISEFTCPTPSTTHASLTHCKLTGLLTPHALTQTLTQLRRVLASHQLPWIAITVHGFHDAPVSAPAKHHGYSFHGDHSYTVVIFPEDRFWIYKAIGDLDVL